MSGARTRGYCLTKDGGTGAACGGGGVGGEQGRQAFLVRAVLVSLPEEVSPCLLWFLPVQLVWKDW